MNKKVTFKETVELFLTNTIYELSNKSEIPKINFIFNEEAYKTFYEIMNNPFKIDNGYKPNIKEKDINYLKAFNDSNYPTIYVKDHIKFFTYLTNITNYSIELHQKYNKSKPARTQLIQILKRIWLRMSPNDFHNIEEFLYKQLEFVKTDIFEDYKFKNFNKRHIINNFNNYEVIAENSLNNTWDESTKCMSFRILTEYNLHTLPNIYYDTINDTCYIYAIQNDRNPNKIAELDKLIYKKYRGNSQPNKVYALKLFINLLKEKGIKTIKVPTLQVLNYGYHEILSKNESERFKKLWPKYLINNLTNWEEIEYKNDLKWYNHIVDKEDTISKIKTEDLIYLIYRIVNEDDTLLITNDIDISDTLEIKIKTLKQDK